MVLLENLESDSNFAPIWFHFLSTLDEEDKDIEELFDNFDGPDEVIPYVISLKEEGNALFKSNKFGNAFIKYNKAIKSLCIVVSAVCDGDVDACENNPFFRELIIAITLNMAACAIKLDKLSEAIVYCSLVLEADVKNVKALFRKGLALMKLGKMQEAYEELKKAKNLDPKNKEIVNQFSELQTVVQNKKFECSNVKDFRNEIGNHPHKSLELQEEKHKTEELELGNPNSRNEQKQKEKVKEEVMEFREKTMQEHDMETTDSTKSLEVHSEGHSEVHSCVTFAENQDGSADSHSCPTLGMIMETGKEKFHEEEIKEEIMENKLSNEEHEDMLSSVSIERDKKTLNHAKPRYRFQNRRRQGSLLTLSKEDYLMISQGKTLKCYNARMGSYMEVGKANKLAGTSSNGNGFHEQQSICSLQGDNQSSNNEQQGSMDLMEMHSCVISKDDEDRNMETNSCSNADDECSSQATKHTYFKFSAKPKLAAKAERNMLKRTTPRSATTTVKMIKKRKTLMPCRSIYYPTNICCDYRFKLSKKRKCAYPLALESYQHPRKRERYSSSVDWS